MIVLGFVLGLLVGALAVWLVMRHRASIATEFRALSAEALKSSNEEFLQLATTQFEGYRQQARGDLDQRRQAFEQLLVPLKDTLTKYDQQAQSLEASRQKAYGELSSQVETLTQTQERLRSETSELVKALRSPSSRGRWGEMQLRRTLETAGMLAHCDFDEQATVSSEDGVLRPDVVIRLAGGKKVVVDAKVPLEALLDISDADDEATRELHYQTFVRHVRTHLAKLSLKSYWEQFERSPEFVVMYLPSEAFYRYALEKDDTLMEAAATQNVVLAGPMNLIGLLKVIALGWREEALAENAAHVSELGRELYARLATMGRHFANLGTKLTSAVEAYNETVGSLETRVLPSARRFREVGVPAKDEIAQVASIERLVRPLTADELVDVDVDAA
jgi:DNA recombination protein RmuC